MSWIGALIFCALGWLVVLHQVLVGGSFEYSQLLDLSQVHHEHLVLLSWTLALVFMLLEAYRIRRK